MADLFSLLTSLDRTLQVDKTSVQTTSNNIQNANTPGYARQRADLAAGVPSDFSMGQWVGGGVTLQSISQARDKFVESQIPAASGKAASSTAQSDALGAVTALDPNQPGGLSSSLSAFYSSLSTLSQNPGDSALRSQVISSAQTLAASFHTTANSLESARSGLDQQVSGQLDQVNSLASQLASLNAQIRAAKAQGGSPNDLLDARLQVQDQLVQMTGAQPITASDGDVTLLLGGAALVTGATAGSVSAIADPNNGGHLALQLTPAGSPAAQAIPSGALSGSIGGAIAARDGALKQAEDGVDSLAFNFATQINAVHSAGFAQDGSTGRALFDVSASSAGAASSLAVDSAISADPRLLAAAGSASAASGDNSNLLSMVATQDQANASGVTSASQLSTLTSSFGAAVQGVQAVANQDAAWASHLSDLRDSTSGVNIDEEMIELTKAQRAFEAASKVVTVANDMLGTLLAMAGVTTTS